VTILKALAAVLIITGTVLLFAAIDDKWTALMRRDKYANE
jgi:Flp pilus assembly pilin Flp